VLSLGLGLGDEPVSLLNLTNAHVHLNPLPNERLIVHEDSGLIRLVDLTSRPPREMLSIPATSSFAYNPERRLCAWGGADGTIHVRSEDGVQETQWQAYSNEVDTLEFLNGGRHLVTAHGDGHLRLWDVDQRIEKGSIDLADHSVLAISQDGWVAVVGPSLHLRRLDQPERPPVNLEIRGLVSGIAFSPELDLVAAVTEAGWLKVWELPSGVERFGLRGHLMGIHGVAFSPDGQRLATGGSGREALKLWDVVDGQQVMVLAAEGSLFKVLQFSASGDMILASHSNENIAHLWRAPSWEEIAAEEAKEKAESKQP
jgi:WD40 repeat protein